MNYEDFGEILQDDFTGTLFGDEGQLEVVGYIRNPVKYASKLYILKCSECAKDSELFGDGVFKSLKGNLKTALPCGCAHKPNWSREQYQILCQRQANKKSYKFLGFSSQWKGNKTKLLLKCPEHGEWNTTTINDFISTNRGCLLCYRATIYKRVRKPDDVMVASFFASGAFHPDTKFWRSDRKNKAGNHVYWNMECPVCETTGSSVHSNLQKGSRPCACKNNQTQAYINLIEDSGIPVALKFGIATIAKRRTYEQNLRSGFSVTSLKVYEFPNKELCVKAETECKRTLVSGILTSAEMPDGWSETTFVYNLDKIKEIYINNGAVEI